MTVLWSVSVTGATSKGAASMPAAFQNEERPTPAVVASKIKKERDFPATRPLDSCHSTGRPQAETLVLCLFFGATQTTQL